MKWRCPNRTRAHEEGETHYISTKPCKRGHFSPRRVKDGTCQTCNRGSVKSYRIKTNRKICPEYQAEWRKRNKGRLKGYEARRCPDSIYFKKLWRGRLKRATPKWINEKDMLEIKEIYDLCRIASSLSGIPHDVDHIIPINGKNVCGLHVPNNLQILTAFENRSKGNRMEIKS